MSDYPPRYGQPLTPMEYETVRLQAEGFTLPDIALRRGRAVQTVKNHANAVHAKLGVNSTVEAFRVLGWLHVPEPGAEPLTSKQVLEDKRARQRLRQTASGSSNH
jgi:DNA-binding CsgD family transcriptional regulator